MAAEGAVAHSASCRIKYVPRAVRFNWGGAFEGYARGFVRRNFWRVRELLGTEEDALQECALIFVRCKNLYEGKVDNDAWFMSLYKRALALEWITMSGKDSRIRSVPVPEDAQGIDHNVGELSAAIAGGSAELKRLFSVLANAPSEFLSLMFNKAELVMSDNPSIAQEASVKLNRRLRRLLGIKNASADIVSEMRAILDR